jgi:MFS transporter, DHA2 family, multidrug resistance protein
MSSWGGSTRERDGGGRWGLAVSLLAVGLDLTVLNVALPTLAVDLHAGTGELQWISTAYTLVLAAALLPAGLLGDRFGRKRLLLGALVLFGLASLACAYSTGTGELIAARAVLGLAAAFLMPLSMAVLVVLFPPAERPRAMAVWATASMIGLPLGPIVGGWLLDHFWWGSAFLINVPMVVVGLVAVAWLLPESRSADRPRLDLAGALLAAAGLAALSYGLIQAGPDGWGAAGTLLPLFAGALLLIAFGFGQRRQGRIPGGRPLVDLGLFGEPGFRWGAVLTTLINFALFGLLFTMPAYFQWIDGTDALGTGLRLLPMLGGMAVGIGAGKRLGDALGAKATVAIGYAVLAAGLLLGTGTGPHTGYGFVALWFAVLGAGLGTAMPTAMTAALAPLPADRGGSGSALLTALRQVGGTVGVALLGTVLSAGYTARLGALPGQVADTVRSGVGGGVAVARALHSPELLARVQAAYAHGVDATLWTCGGIALAGVVIAVLFLPARSATMTGGIERDRERDVVGGS